MPKTSDATLSAIEATVGEGRAVVAADSGIIIAMMQEALRAGRSATFYVPPPQAQSVMRWYWTPGRVREYGMELVSLEERKRIESELGIKDMGPWYSNRIPCSCGGIYGGFEFMKHGLAEHGKNWVGAVFALKNTAVLRINPTQTAFCPNCGAPLIIMHNYEMMDDKGTLIYGCCSGELPGGTILA